ncbi:hypothetical protein ACO2Q2_17495 [Dyella sp. KRB-257]|uniref:hypothetical protein n=1 Tax=Dyella sp. KRB-257 TaxID=3400915 RepID=UPI003BFF9D84
MNAPVPHIGQTLQQKRAIADYTAMQAELEAERSRKIEAQMATEQLLDRVRQTGTGECHAQDEAPAHLPTWRDVAGLYAADMAIGLLFAIGWGGVLLATWLHGPDLADYVGAVLRVFGSAK